MRRIAILLLIINAAALNAQQAVTPPREFFGYDIGADYVLPNYQRLTEYWRKLDAQSDRMIVQEIGKTQEGRPQLMAIITSAANQLRLARYQEIAGRLALAEGLTDGQARALANEGKAVVWIDGGLHATEVLGAQQLMETVYQLVSKSDAETTRILDDVVVLAVHANPDGHDLVADWYMRSADSTRRSTSGVPRLYQKYAGHDNNRDSYMNALAETRNMSRIQFREWFPQIVYNHHQSGPSGSVLFAPPFRDPFNYNLDPLVPAGIDALGAAMHSRFITENKPGAVTRRATRYSNWWNGGIRTTVGFHNMIGLLTETIGNPTPVAIPFVPRLQLASTDVFMPIEPQQVWHFRQSIDYSVTANYAVLDYAARHREQLLYGIYRMGRNSIERGQRDSWTVGAWDVERVREAFTKDSLAAAADSAARDSASSTPQQRYERSLKYFTMLRDPARRDARGYIMSADQPDFATASRFVNALLMSGVRVLQARAPFTVGRKSYPAGSYVVKTDQAFRPHILDMFEPQQHPNDFQYPGGPPIPPYDNAGYTLAFQMGVQFERILEPFDGPFAAIDSIAKVSPGRVALRPDVAGYVFSHAPNNAFTVVSRLLAAGFDVSWVRDPWKTREKTHPAGTFFVARKPGLDQQLRQLAIETGVSFDAAGKPKGASFHLRQPRIALWDQYGGMSTSGWIRYILDDFGLPYSLVYPPMVDAGALRSSFDVIILPDRAVPRSGGSGEGEAPSLSPDSLNDVPAEWRARMGRYSKEKTAVSLKQFVEQGGALITIGSATGIARDFDLPIEDALVTTDSAGKSRRLRRNDFYVPGSLLDVQLDKKQPLAAGLPQQLTVMFAESPAFRIKDGPSAVGMRGVAWYGREPLRSGWAWGQRYLENALAAAEADVGQGKLFLFGPEITFRGQPHGTFKLLFNAIYYGTAAAPKPAAAAAAF